MSFFKKLLAGLIASTVLIAWAQTELDDGVQGESQNLGVSLPNYEYLERITNFRGPYTDQDDPVLLKAQQKEADRTGVDPREFVCRPPHCSRDKSRLIIKLATPGAVAKRKSQNFGVQSSDLLDSATLTPIFKPQAVAKAVSKYNQTNSAMPMNSMGKRVDLSRWNTLRLPKAVDIDQAIAELELDPRVEVVESDFERQLKGSESKPADGSGVASPMVTANDPRMPEQWALGRTRTEEAWQWLEDNGYPAWGDRNIVVAVIDSGVDYTHEDLAGNVWINAGEIPDNNIDDDNNGFIDDVYGADVVGSTYDHDGDPQDDNGHGTHVAGIIAAQGDNGIGIIGVAPNAQIMAIKAAQYSGVLTSTDISEAILYAYQQGADIINMSFGGSGRSVLEEEALAVAFSNAVLIAAAGNQGIYNDTNCGILARPSYPAAHPYVLGVMAEAQLPNQYGAYLAGFSNWDCKARNGIEYEVMAPGVDVLSTIPGDGYAAWDGTSMAAPVVAGMAALVRTRFEDKSIYSSRFIMGQLGSTGASKVGLKECETCKAKSFLSADALQSLVNVPAPSLSYLQHYLFDGADQGTNNDDDGIVDAGETLEVAIVVKNYWGMADNVEVTLEAQAEGAVAGPDPYVTWDVPTVNYGGVGSFNEDDNGLIYDEGGLITGVRVPFRFTVAEDTPNEHIIPMLVTMTANNGLDPDDSAAYTTTSRFNLIVQRGRELPSIIGSDAPGTPGGNLDTDGVEDGIVTLDDSALWLVEKPVLIETGAHLRVGPGAILQFGNNQADDVYAEIQRVFLQYNGRFETAGTPENPVTIKPSDLFNRLGTVISNCPTWEGCSETGSAEYSYTNFFNPIIRGNKADHVNVTRTIINQNLFYRVGEYRGWEDNPRFEIYDYDSTDGNAGAITHSRFRRLGLESPWASYDNGVKPSGGSLWRLSAQSMAMSLIENTMMSSFPTDNSSQVTSTVLLNNNQRWVNSSGEYITQGSDFYLSQPESSDLRLVDTYNYNDKTYALIYVYFEDSWGDSQRVVGNIDRVRSIVQVLGGDLFVPSNVDEIAVIQPWLNQLRNDLDTLSKVAEVTGIDCDTWQSVCERLRDPNDLTFGILYQDGALVTVTGEQPVYPLYPDYNALSDDKLSQLENAGRSQGYVSYYPYCQQFECINPYYGGTNYVVLEIPGALDADELQVSLDTSSQTVAAVGDGGNAILNQWHDPNIYHWARIRVPGTNTARTFFNSSIDLSGIYWGDVSEDLIRLGIADYQSDFNKMPVRLSPIETDAPVVSYPFMSKLEILDADANERPDQRFANEQTVWRVTFNRDMNQEIQPFVTFGPDEPYTDFIVPGDWIDARTWEGRVTISPVATDGYQYVRVAGAVAADDPWLVTGDDKRRFRFEVITSGTESLNLQASGGEGYVDLSWSQDDYDTLMGFNIYRSTNAENGFVRINQTLVGNEDRSFRDDGTEPGVQYFYYFTVALDGSESEPSNVASATPIDTVKPQMSHDVISATTFGSTVLIQAEVTDNIAVQEVTLYYRAIGTTAYTSVAMANTSGNTYRASIPASATLPPGVEYYIAATDGASYTYSGRASSPNTISVDNSPVVTSVVPSAGSAAGGESVIVSGNNFAEGASVTLGGATCQNVVVESASRISCVTPASAPNLVAVSVTNPDGGSGTLTSAYTFVGNSTSLALPDVEAQKGQTLDVALTVGAVSSLQSFSATITWNSSHLQLANVVKGPLVSGWELEYSESTVDASIRSVTIAAGSGTRVSGSGALALLEFVVVAEGEVSSALTITSAQMNEGTIEVDVQDGSFSVAPGYGISGSVRFWDSSRTPIEATVTLDGTDEVITSPTTGIYSFAGLLDAQHDVTVEKDDGINESIRLYDASLVLSHVVGVAPLSGPALIAADTSGNGSVTEQDAAQILEVAAGLRGLPFVNQASPWQFTPPEYSYDSLTSDITNADFTAVFTGDVSGNWADVGLQSVSGLRTELESISREGVAKVKLYVTPPNLEQAVSALELGFDATTGVSLLEVTRGELLATWRDPMVSVEDSVYGNYFKVSLYDDLRGAFSTEVHALTLTLSLADGEQVLAGVSGWVNEYQSANFETLVLRMPDDNDGDFVPNAEDAFPDDVAASVDTDGDGMPDTWNEGYGATDSSTGLVVDPDDDGDGYSDIEELSEGSDPLDSNDQPFMHRMSPGILRSIIDLYLR